MENINSEAVGVQKNKCRTCTKDRSCETCLIQTLLAALGKVDKLMDSIEELKRVIGLQSKRISNLEVSGDSDSGTSNLPAKHSASGRQVKQSEIAIGKSKTDRVVEEKDKQIKVLREKLVGTDIDKSESSDSLNDTCKFKSKGGKSQDKKKCYFKHQVLCGQKKVGEIYSDDSDTSTCSSEVSGERMHILIDIDGK